MTAASHTRLNVEELFQQWKQFLDNGTLTTASVIAADQPDLIPSLQELINDHLSEQAGNLDATLSRAFDPEATVTDSPLNSKSPKKPPDIPGYTFIKLLGHGGMGDVWHVKDPLDREYALKLAHADRLSAVGRQRFHDEARAMHKVADEHIVKVHHFEWHNDTPYFLMPIYAASLKDRLADYQADTKKAVRLMAAVAKAVGHLHAQGFVHRDLKPGNVLLTESGEPAVSDLGLVKSVADDTSGLDSAGSASGSGETKPSGARRSRTIIGTVMGTKAYMAPEQAAGLTHLANPKWDVFSLGVMLHELLTGQLPRSSSGSQKLLDPNEPENAAATLVKPGLDPRLSAIVAKCLRKDEGERYGDGLELSKVLRTWLGDREPIRQKRIWVAGIVVCLAAATVLVAILVPRHREQTPGQLKAELTERLQQGETIDLIPAGHLPILYDLVVGKDLVQPYVSEVDGSVVIDTSRLVLMEFPAFGVDNFQFEVEVQQLSQQPAPRFGIYCSRHKVLTYASEIDCFASIWFNEMPNTLANGIIVPATSNTTLRFYDRRKGNGGLFGGLEFDPQPISSDSQSGRPTYHKMRVQVTVNGLNFSFEEARAKAIALPLDHRIESNFKEAAGLPVGFGTDFALTGGYGLLVYGGSAAFKNAKISSIANK